MFPGVGNLRFPWKVSPRLSAEQDVSVAQGILLLVALTLIQLPISAPPGVELSTLLQYVFLSWAVEWKCHTIAQAGAFIAPATVMRPGEARVHPAHFLVLQPHPLKHG